MGGQCHLQSSLPGESKEEDTLESTALNRRSKPVLTQTWVNDAAYFDGTGFAQITFSEESARMQRFEQEVKLLSHNGILLLLQNGVKRSSTPLSRKSSSQTSELSFDCFPQPGPVPVSGRASGPPQGLLRLHW